MINMEKIFVTGASGLLGSNIIETLSEKFQIYGSYNKNKVDFKKHSIIQTDLTNTEQTKSIEKICPNLIIHCAALVNIDACEKNPKNAYLQNIVSTENIVKIAEKTNSFLIHISTDAVFDGTKGNYSEKDETNPINIYGETKLQSEKIVENSDIESCIVRTNIYGWNKLNKFSLAEWMIDKLENNEKLNAFHDVKFTPILVNNLANALFEIYKKRINGILHVSGSESCTKYEFAKNVANVFDLDKNLIFPISVDDIHLKAKRGKNISLDTKKAQSLLDTKLFNVADGLKEMKRLKEEK